MAVAAWASALGPSNFWDISTLPSASLRCLTKSATPFAQLCSNNLGKGCEVGSGSKPEVDSNEGTNGAFLNAKSILVFSDKTHFCRAWVYPHSVQSVNGSYYHSTSNSISMQKNIDSYF